MTTRVSTVGNYAAVLSNMLAAQQKQIASGEKVASQKNGSDLKGFARNAEMLTAMRSVHTRVEGYLNQNKVVADRMTTQDLSLTQVADAVAAAKRAIQDALAGDSANTLILDMNGQLRNAVEGMNARYGGKYIFAGGQVDTKPVSATALSDLTAPAAVISDFFHNDRFITEAQVDDATRVATGVLADDVGTDLMTAFRDIQAFHEATPFGGPLTAAQRTFLEGQLAVWDQVEADMIDVVGRNGLTASRVEQVRDDLIIRRDSLAEMIGGITDADMAEAVAELQQAQISVQAAAQVFITLKESSLLNVLR